MAITTNASAIINPPSPFMTMASKVARQLANSEAMKSLTTAEDFEFVAVDHDEPIETALRRMRQLSGS